MMICPRLHLNSGHNMPQVGLGIHQVGEDELIQAVETALESGYRYLDSSFLYNREETLGKALQKQLDQGKVYREELFVLSKLPQNGMRPELVEWFLLKSLSRLRLDYLDMYLIHFPCGTLHTGNDEETHPLDSDGFLLQDLTTDLPAVWTAMEDLVTKGLVRSIGLSNFNIKQVKRILDNCKIIPANLQVEMNILHQNIELFQFCRENNIVVTAFAPLGSPGRFQFQSTVMFPRDDDARAVTSILSSPEVLSISREMNCSPGQVLLHFLTKVLGVVVIPKSTNPVRIRENIDIFSLRMNEEQIKVLRSMDRNIRSFKADVFKVREKHPEFPF